MRLFKKDSEQGRSMVEMLGVLAIMGVLSVGGIAALSYGIRKSRANTLLNEAQKRAVVVAGQINLKNDNPSLDEFITNQFGSSTFETTVYGATGDAQWTKSDRQFTLAIADVDGGVCKKMKEVSGRAIKVFKPDTCDLDGLNIVKLTYNNDLSPDDISEEQTDVCENGNVYLSYMDDPCATETPMNQETCETDSDCWEGSGRENCCNPVTHRCRAAYQTVIPNLGDSYICSEGDECKSNRDCAEGEFCEMARSNGGDEDCSPPNIGTCAPIGDYTDSEDDDPITTMLGHLRLSDRPMYWWAAENWCKAQNMRLLNISEFGCYTCDPKTHIVANSGLGGDCWAQSIDSCKIMNSWYWFRPENKDYFSQILFQIRDVFGDELTFWTASNFSSNSCGVYTISTDSAYVTRDIRSADLWWGNGTLNRALCIRK